MDYDRIQQIFMDITGVDAEHFKYRQMIENGRQLVTSRLKVDVGSLDQVKIGCCEYAAAACAAYEYACADAATERPVMSENGEVVVRRGSAELADAMKKLRASAFDMLAAAGLTNGGGFAFKMI